MMMFKLFPEFHSFKLREIPGNMTQENVLYISLGKTIHIFLFQKLETLMKMMAAGVPDVEVESLTVIDGKDGSKATQMASFIEQLQQTTGIDAAQIANNLTGNNDVVKSVKNIKATEADEL